MQEVKKTSSVCPKCYKTIPASLVEDNNIVYIQKTCPEHGEFKDKYSEDYEQWKRFQKHEHIGRGVWNPKTKITKGCPWDCGLCNQHHSHTSLLNIAVTNRCNLACFYCFFYAQKCGYVYEPTMEQIKKMLQLGRDEKPVPCTAVQLTGGEPTIREDLPEIVKMAREMGYKQVQVNSNAIRLGTEPDYAKKLRDAGTSTVYMSFDGVSKKTNPWLEETTNAIENCRKAGLGIVLVPVVIRGINDHELGDIIRFAAKNIDVIRGVNFQPVSFVGTMDKSMIEKQRITQAGTILNIAAQSEGITKDDFFPVPTIYPITRLVEALKEAPQYDLSAHQDCGAATYLFKDGDKLIPISRFVDVEGFLDFLGKSAEELEQGKNKLVIGAKGLMKINKFINSEKQPSWLDLKKLLFNVLVKGDYKALGDFHKKSLFIGMMHFQDPMNYNIERVQRCVIHYATPDGRIIPFCAFNVFPEKYRDEIQSRYGMPIEEWEKEHGKLSDKQYVHFQRNAEAPTN
ncbi:MAG: radical SAM protein [Candidatus Diapherotrites archaeon]|nr:radical SAM protein [Candidatus Diapherotrites archaeon]